MTALRTLARAALLVAWASAACAQSAPPDGAISTQAQAAFEAGDYARAATLWSDAAASGDPDGLFGLALLNDGGYGRPRDVPAAFALYLSAAQAGLARAQFNVAVMLDAGLGTARDARAAMTWYTRAALRGNARAQYNLGLMIESGLDGPPDPDRAAIWFGEAAAALPAAAAKLRGEATGSETGMPGGAPAISFAERRNRKLELVWAADGSGGASFTVQVVPLPWSDGAETLAVGTRLTGLLMDDAFPSRDVAVRVVRRDVATRDYVASDWVLGTGPAGFVDLTTTGADPAMSDFANAMSADLQAAGMVVRRDTEPAILAVSSTDAPNVSQAASVVVSYGWRQDAALAGQVAGLLPFADGTAARFDPSADLQPGEVRIRISGGG